MNNWKIHVRVLFIILIGVFGISLLFWFHPTLGYVKGGFLDGMDVRIQFIGILWMWFICFGLSSSIVLKLTIKITKKWFIWLVVYGFGIVTVVLSIPLIEKYY